MHPSLLPDAPLPTELNCGQLNSWETSSPMSPRACDKSPGRTVHDDDHHGSAGCSTSLTQPALIVRPEGFSISKVMQFGIHALFLLNRREVSFKKYIKSICFFNVLIFWAKNCSRGSALLLGLCKSWDM